jgi:hypothetical protein
VESSCELGNEPSGFIKCWELSSGCTTCGLSSGTQLHRVGYLMLPFAIYSGFCRVFSEYVRFEVFTAMTMKNGVFWDVTPCSSCKN